MTKKEFISLSPSAQETFLAEGGSVTDCAQQNEQPPSGFMYSPEVETSHKETILPSLSSSVEPSSPPSAINFKGYDIEDPVELLVAFDRQIRDGTVSLYGWQIQCLVDFAKGGSSDVWPFQAVVQACNGSGKDIYVIAACIVWLCMRYKYTVGVITSSSGVQLDRQTCRYIKFLGQAINREYKTLFGFEPWVLNYRHYQCLFPSDNGSLTEDEKSEVFCYATDEAGKAEGYHPTVSGAKMAIMVSEDKTVADDINVALNKCTGYTHRVHASTPGIQLGHFYDYCNLAIDRKLIGDIHEVTPTDWIKYKVTAYDCEHLVRTNYISQMKRDLPGGENGSAFRSQVLSEFGTTDEMVVIPYTYIWRAVNKPPIHIPCAHNDAGLDLSDGGAETVLVVRNGNKVIAIIPFKFDDTLETERFLVEKFKEYNLDNPHSTINGDCTGIGSPILKHLRGRKDAGGRGWTNIKLIDSRAAARRPKVYKNRATELFFNLRTFLERYEIILLGDEQTNKQLGGRYYKITIGNVHQLLSKTEQRSKGYPSPDRADALNLAFWNYQTSYIEDEATEPFEEVQPDEKEITGVFDQRGWASGATQKWKANDGVAKTNFSYLEEEIARYNKSILTK